jgi:hypothetical protein
MNKNTTITNFFRSICSKGFFFAIFCLCLFVNSSCSTPTLNKSKSYDLKFQDSDWKRIEPDTSDYAFLNSKTNSIIMVNSLCKKYEATSLKHLTSNILAGIQDIKVEDRLEKTYFSRSALVTHVSGSFDGVPVFLTITTIAKNRCTYDFILISRTKEKRLIDEKSLNLILDKSIIK